MLPTLTRDGADAWLLPGQGGRGAVELKLWMMLYPFLVLGGGVWAWFTSSDTTQGWKVEPFWTAFEFVWRLAIVAVGAWVAAQALAYVLVYLHEWLTETAAPFVSDFFKNAP